MDDDAGDVVGIRKTHELPRLPGVHRLEHALTRVGRPRVGVVAGPHPDDVRVRGSDGHGTDRGDLDRGIPANLMELGKLGTAQQQYIPWMQATYVMVANKQALQYLPAGADVRAYMNQAAFLLGAGIADLLMALDPEQARTFLPASRAVQKLVSPAEMGELFKVLVVGHGVALPDPIARADRSHRL